MKRKVIYDVEEFDDIKKLVLLHSDILETSVSYDAKSGHYVVEITESFTFEEFK